MTPPGPGANDLPAGEGPGGIAGIAIGDLAVSEIAGMWEEFRLLARHGPCRNCERMHGALARLRQALLEAGSEAGAERLRQAIEGVRRPAELHPPLGCRPCSTESALRSGARHPGAEPGVEGRCDRSAPERRRA
jgi:hypothetical protein